MAQLVTRLVRELFVKEKERARERERERERERAYSNSPF
jgi:hypothetical protein